MRREVARARMSEKENERERHMFGGEAKVRANRYGKT